MTISKIVAKHGLPVTVRAQLFGYPPFTIIKTIEKGWLTDEGNFVADDQTLDDYELHPLASMNK